MKQAYQIITDAAADVIPGLAAELNIGVIPMEVDMGETSFSHWVDYRNMSGKEFYRQVRAGILPHTSQIVPQGYLAYFTKVLEEGRDLLYLAFSSGLSGTYHSCLSILQELKERFPQRKVYAVDSLSATGGEGLLACYAAKNREKGLSLEENVQWCEENRLHMACYGTVDDLFHLKRGGRAKALEAYFGTLLNIKPIGHVDEEGHLPIVQKVRGRKTSLRRMVEIMKENIVQPEGQNILICHGDSFQDAEYMKTLIVDSGLPVGNVLIGEIGPVIGLGPGAITLHYWSKRR